MSPDIFILLATLIFEKSLSTHSLPNLQEVYYKKLFFENPPTVGFQKTILVFLAPLALEIPKLFS